MQIPKDPLDPPTGRFAEPWHAQTLAMAHALITAGHITPAQWTQRFSQALAQATAQGAPDTETTYYEAALATVEALATATTPLTPSDLATRKAAWTDAYLATPHGSPVTLDTRPEAPPKNQT